MGRRLVGRPGPGRHERHRVRDAEHDAGGKTGTAILKIDLLWAIYQSEQFGSWTVTGFTVTVTHVQSGQVVSATTTGLEGGTVIVNDASEQRNVNVDPTGDGLSLTRTINNVQAGDTFTITVDPYSEADNILPGATGTVDVSLSLDARVTVN